MEEKIYSAEQNEETREQNEEQEVKYTQSQYDSGISKAVASALKRADKAREKAVAEAQRVAQLSDDERQKEYIRTLESEKADLEKKFRVMENTKVCLEECAKRNIPSEFNNFIVCEDADEMVERLNLFEKALKRMVNEEVQKKIPSTIVNTGNIDTEKLTKEKFRKLSIAEQNQIYNNDKDLYMSLIN